MNIKQLQIQTLIDIVVIVQLQLNAQDTLDLLRAVAID